MYPTDQIDLVAQRARDRRPAGPVVLAEQGFTGNMSTQLYYNHIVGVSASGA